MRTWLVLLFVAGSALGWAQFPATYTVPATGAVVTTAVTDTFRLYRITVTGSYSMWPQFTDCHGVDGGYVYDVPQEEIDNLRWPPPVLKVGGQDIPFVTIPHWVGDETVWAFPSPPAQPLFELSFRRFKGLRVDGFPVPNRGLTALHRYQVEKMGTGRPFRLQILDSNYHAATATVVPRYEDNCGSLKVRVEVVQTRDLNICGLETRCDAQKRTNGFVIWTSLFETNSQGLRSNRMNGVDRKLFTAVSNRGVSLTVDSVSCTAYHTPVAVGMLVDRSGSMVEFISPRDPTVRMDASKEALTGFIERLRRRDTGFVMSFADDVTVDQDWTSDKTRLQAAVDALQPGGKTQFFGAVDAALEKLSRSPVGKRALVMLSDGANTVPPWYAPEFLDRVRAVNIPVYIIALGLSNEPSDIDGRQKMQMIADASRGQVFDVDNASALDSVYTVLSRELMQEDCCGVFVSMPPCLAGTTHTITLTYRPPTGLAPSQSIEFACDSCAFTTAIEGLTIPTRPSLALSCTPSLTRDRATIHFRLEQPMPVRIEVLDLAGRRMLLVEEGPLSAGPQSRVLSLSTLPAGTYLLSLITPLGRATQYVKRLP